MEEQECHKYINNNQIQVFYRDVKCYGWGPSIFPNLSMCTYIAYFSLKNDIDLKWVNNLFTSINLIAIYQCIH